MTHDLDAEKARLRMREDVGAIVSHLVGRGVLTAVRDVSQPPDLYSQQNVVLPATCGPLEVIVKLYPSCARDCWEREAYNLELYHRHQMPVARLLDKGVADLPQRPSYYYSFLSVVPGKCLGSVFKDDSSSALLRSIASGIVHLLHRQEAIARFPTATDYPQVLPAEFVRATWARVCMRYRAVLTEVSLPSSFFSRVDALVTSITGPMDFGWVTFDWRLRHLFWDAGRISGLLDLESAKASDSLIELSNLVHDVLLNGSAQVRRELAELVYSLYFESCLEPAEQAARRFRFYLIRQAVSHAAVKRLQGIADERISRELAYASTYLDAESPSAIFACY